MREFEMQFPVAVVVEKAAADPETGRYRVQGVLSIEADGRRAVTVFSDRTLAVQFARSRGLADAQVGLFDDPIDMGYFLQEQQKSGFTDVCVDPQGLHPPFIPISDVLSYLAGQARQAQ